MKKIAIFASGGGSNAQKIIEHFKGHPSVEIALVISNKKDAGVLGIAANHQIPTHIIERQSFYNTDVLLSVLKENSIDFIALAGFLWLVPSYLVKAFPKKIVNIHPALLPKYGGKGMYGHFVHEAVKAANETESGMTIHYVDEHYDEGTIIFQAKCAIDAEDSAAEIARKVLALEHQHFPLVIEKALRSLNTALTKTFI